MTALYARADEEPRHTHYPKMGEGTKELRQGRSIPHPENLSRRVAAILLGATLSTSLPNYHTSQGLPSRADFQLPYFAGTLMCERLPTAVLLKSCGEQPLPTTILRRGPRESSASNCHTS